MVAGTFPPLGLTAPASVPTSSGTARRARRGVADQESAVGHVKIAVFLHVLPIPHAGDKRPRSAGGQQDVPMAVGVVGHGVGGFRRLPRLIRVPPPLAGVRAALAFQVVVHRSGCDRVARRFCDHGEPAFQLSGVDRVVLAHWLTP